ncbi:hypothetical protein PAXRUDRAFT_24916 [Paxillus rubicundulus Ve08.2h10]|uniref:Unplaced genomic scaffold scaffold_145, whole genome shotgun sequence n=1 Tax=Paxillus rubicundulus Ve08.2h10 TaxID=930991 RepID=A0A0D0DT01_9AGAM|nr:hypothetical protein PAXRUDRAFT_24916 [Paxillus rubicundulus Ve08.2h10]
MGMLAESKDVDMAVEEMRSVGKVKVLKHLKATDLPIGDMNYDHTQWEQLVCGVIDWSETLDDPFGTNKHPKLFSITQELWYLLFKDGPLNVQDHPAIKKLDSQYRNDNLKGPWELLLVVAVLSYHITHVGQLLFQRHSPPSGILATATASVKHAFTIYKSSESAKENNVIGSASGKK